MINICGCRTFQKMAVSDSSVKESITRQIGILHRGLELLNEFCTVQLCEVKEDVIWLNSVFDFVFE